MEVALFSNRFTTLTFCVLLDSICGLQYIYGTFSVPIKNRFHLSQTVIDNGGLAQNIGNNFGIFAGPVLDAIGPKPVIVTAGLIGGLAYLAMFLMYDEAWAIAEHPWMLYLILFFQGQAQMLADMSIVVTVSRRFQDTRGLAIGLCKSFLGLSGSIAEQIQVTFFPGAADSDDPKELPFVLFLSIYFTCICFLVAVFVQAGEPYEGLSATERYQRRIAATEVITTAIRFMPTIILLLLGSIAWKYGHGNSRAVELVFSISIFCAMVCLLTLISRGSDERKALDDEESDDRTGYSEPFTGDGNQFTESLLRDGDHEDDLHQNSSNDHDRANTNNQEALPAPDMTMREVTRDPAFWIQTTTLLIAWGAALTVINNVGQISEVVGMSKRAKDLVPSLISIFNCLGRLTAGLTSDDLVRNGIPRPVVFGSVVALLGVMICILIISTPAAVYTSAILVGYLYGGLNVLSPAILGDLFGVKNIGVVYSSSMLAVIAGSFFIANKLFAIVYEAHAQRDDQGREYCIGAPCIRLSIGITSILCVGIGLIHTTYFYRRFAHKPTTI
mmetsp:Transcript_21198/g.41572  ORF Transcript_21198/g.41572 Transcript_21198/m.41572 type:complete len:557 (-) Transcript_21198:65-1735(-)